MVYVRLFDERKGYNDDFDDECYFGGGKGKGRKGIWDVFSLIYLN